MKNRENRSINRSIWPFVLKKNSNAKVIKTVSNSSILIIEALSTMLSGGGMMLTQFTPPVNMGTSYQLEFKPKTC